MFNFEYTKKSIGSDSIDLYRFRLNLNLEAAIENQQASNKAKSIESDPIDFQDQNDRDLREDHSVVQLNTHKIFP